MAYTQKQATQLKLADISMRKQIEKNLISAANQQSIPVHYLEILWVSTETERLAVTGVVNCGHFHPGEATDILFTYLNIPGLKRDFYRIQVMPLSNNDFAQKAALVDLEGHVVREISFKLLDPVGGVFGNEPVKKIFRPGVEGFINRKSEYMLIGALDAGKPFLISIPK